MIKAEKVSNIVGLLTCPYCGHEQQEEIPMDACTPFYNCQGCGQLVAAKDSCCVFCDYGDSPCPAGANGHGGEG